MSANNWRICPRCMKQALETKDRLQKQATESYGKIPVDEYVKFQRAAERDILLEETLREDYEFHMGNDGEFSASYGAQCGVCNFHYEYEHNEKVAI